MSRLDPEALQRCFIGWMQAVVQATAGDVVAIDGKTLRRSFDTATRKRALHMVSAWGCANGVVLGQVRTSEKSNEITAIPALLELLDVRGCIVTIDAMGCQRVIAEQIRAKRGHYVLAVKENQGALLSDIRDYFEADAEQGYRDLKAAYHEETDSGHGRVEVRRCWQSADLRWVPASQAWAGAKSVARIECERHIKGKISREVRYYVSSLAVDAARLLAAVRSHWAIENRLHWVLDMTFREDYSRVRRGHAAENLTTLRRMALNICRRNQTGKSNPSKIRRASWNDDFRQALLIGAGS